MQPHLAPVPVVPLPDSIHRAEIVNPAPHHAPSASLSALQQPFFLPPFQTPGSTDNQTPASPAGIAVPGLAWTSQTHDAMSHLGRETSQHGDVADMEPAYSMVFESDASSITSAAGLQEVRSCDSSCPLLV